MSKLILISLLFIFANSACESDKLAVAPQEQCDEYSQDPGDSCSQSCGSCFNAAAQPGVPCPDTSKVGYSCPLEHLFGCLDWNFGSIAMRRAEAAFNCENQDDVYFGSGTYGSSDAMKGIGQCFRMKVEGVDKELIVQSINTGGDVDGNQFDLTQGDGGYGIFNWCAGEDFSMYPGTTSQWGNQYGGWSSVAGCDQLPEFPKNKNDSFVYDNLRDNCKYAFAKKVRGTNGENPTITDLAQIECPKQLYAITGIKRNDDPVGYSFSNGVRPHGFPNTSVKCGQSGLGYCMTRMMDCRKPSGGWKENVHEDKMVEGFKIVQPCSNDGYSRVDNRCGCMGCYC